MALEKCQSRSAVTLDSYDNYVLRVSGRDEYFLSIDPLSRFKVCISPSVKMSNTMIRLMIIVVLFIN